MNGLRPYVNLFARNLLPGALLLSCLLSCGKKGPLEPPDTVRTPTPIPTTLSVNSKKKTPKKAAGRSSVQTPPKALENLRSFFANGTIYLLWSLPVDTSSSGRYRVCRLKKDGSKICRIVFQPSFSDQDVKPGVLYKYRVTVLDDAAKPLESLPAEIEIRADGINFN